MNAQLNEWLELILRWAHVFAGILWVGATFFFTWLDGRFAELKEKAASASPDEQAGSQVWLVQSGGFYLVQKQTHPQRLSPVLHWFKWEAAITWITGILLFGLMYYHGSYLVSFEEPPISKGAAIGMSFGMMLTAWIIYDLLWKFLKVEAAAIVVSYLLIVLAAYVSCRYLSGRGAYLQVGAVLGTIMTANVWMRILPPQRRMVAVLKEGRPPDLAEGARAKQRSKHNTFIVLPVVFLMISNHYSGTYGSRYNWVILSAVVLAGWAAAKVIRRA